MGWILSELCWIEDEIGRLQTTLLSDYTVNKRTVGKGVLPKEKAFELGAVGPTARASGIAQDMRLLGYSMQEKMVVLPHYHTAYISLTDEELKRFQHRKGDTEGFVNIPFSVKGIRFTALFVEKKDRIKASFRSRGSFPVHRVASEHYGGGGHINAAGGDSFENMEETLRRFEALLPGYANLLKDE